MVATTTLIRLCAKTAFYIGFPTGLLFSILVILLALFPPAIIEFSFEDEIILGIFIGLVALVPISSGYYLWKSGRKIKEYLDLDYSTFKTSLFYTFYVNIRLLILFVFVIIIAGITYGYVIENNISDALLTQIGISLGISFLLFITATLLGTLTTGILTVQISRIILSAAKADLSLIEYSK